MAKKIMIVHPLYKVELGIVPSAIEYVTKEEAIRRGIDVKRMK